MGYELSVNIEYMFNEVGERLEDRIAAAAAAGYARVEMFTTTGRDVASLASALRDNGVEMLSVVADPRTPLWNPERLPRKHWRSVVAGWWSARGRACLS
jgi:hydroxypyruvate isomerase